MKKTLALVLALVMVIGLMAVPVKADFTDSSSIEYTEAVDVLSAIGVINGFENGSFDPAGNLTREQAAKIVAYLMLGEKNADALVATSAPFGDVAADRWSAGYIAYCVNEGIINGRDAKTFDPTGKVTGYEFAKLLLGCLGYSSKIEQYVGASWAINVAKTALDIDLFDGNDGANYNAPMTREEAALYAFNTLKATLVDYDSQGTSIDLGNGVIISTGASKAEEVEIAKDKATIAGTLNAAGTVQFAEKYFDDLELDDDAATADDFGRPAVIWTFDNDEVGTYAEEADFTYTADTKASVFDKDLKDYTVDGHKVQSDIDNAGGTTIADVVYNNSATEADLTVADDKSPADAIADLTAKGTLVEIYADDDDAITAIVVIDTYVGEITKWTAENDAKDIDENVTINGISGINGTFETSAFTEDDADDNTVVLYTVADGDIQSAVAAESVTAYVSQGGTTSFVAGGTTYKYSANADGVATYVKDGDDSLIYLDAYGYAIYITDAPDASTEYAFVLGVDEDGVLSNTPYAKLLFVDGSTKVVETDDLYDGTDGADLDGLVVTYSVDDDGVYSLEKEDNSVVGVDKDIAIDNDKTAVSFESSTVTYANSKTVFVVENDDDEYDVYTGIADVPNLDATNVGDYGIVYNDDNSKLAEVVFVFDATESGSSADDLTYVAMESKGSNKITDASGTYYLVNAVVDGEITTLKLAPALFTAPVEDDLGTPEDETVDPGTLYGEGDVLISSYTENSKGVVTAVTLTTAPTLKTGTGTEDEADGLVGLGTGFYTYDDDTLVFTVDEDGVIEKSDIASINNDDDDTVIFNLDSDTAAIAGLYITIVD